jgi:hypothetical protein
VRATEQRPQIRPAESKIHRLLRPFYNAYVFAVGRHHPDALSLLSQGLFFAKPQLIEKPGATSSSPPKHRPRDQSVVGAPMKGEREVDMARLTGIGHLRQQEGEKRA